MSTVSINYLTDYSGIPIGQAVVTNQATVTSNELLPVLSDDPAERDAALEVLSRIATKRSVPDLVASIVEHDPGWGPPPDVFDCGNGLDKYFAKWGGRCYGVLEGLDESALEKLLSG